MSHRNKAPERIRSEVELTRNNGQHYIAVKSHSPKNDFMTTKKTPRRPTPVRLQRDDDETYDLNPAPERDTHQVASLVPAMEATATACCTQVFTSVKRAKRGDKFGSVVSGAAAVTYGAGVLTSLLHIAYTSYQRDQEEDE